MDRILLLDDETNILRALKRCLRNSDWEIEVFEDPEQACKAAQSRIYDLFISDYKMPGTNGIEFLQLTKEWQPTAQRILLTGQADLTSAVKAVNEAEIFRLLFKPWNDVELIDSVRKALEYRKLLAENKYLAEQQQQHSEAVLNYKATIAKLTNRLDKISQLASDTKGAS
jgi:DNA-binding NtrC family response regulator